MTKLILGTAQFGSDYGIKHDGQPSIEEIERIAQVAWDGGIRIIHTSWQYNLSTFCEAIFREFDWIEKDLDNPTRFSFLGKNGKCVYEKRDAARIADIYQIPLNVLDTRFLKMIEKVRKYEVHARSVFLQGLLLMESKYELLNGALICFGLGIWDYTDPFPSWLPDESKKTIRRFHDVCQQRELKYYEAALGWVLGLEEIDKVIVGVNSAKQIEELLAVKPLKWDYDFSITDEKVLDPRRWPKG